MLTNIKHLLGLLVETESGETLGKIVDINLDIENHAVKNYVARRSFLSKQEYLIKPVQIVSISKDKMIVEDTTVKEKLENDVKETNTSTVLAGVSQINEE